MVIYFTGTGNSEFCARRIAERLDDTCVDSGTYIKNGIAADLVSSKPWVFVSPTYAWQIPAVFAEFIRSGAWNGSREAWFVMTCGGDIGNAVAPLKKLCQEINLNFRGVQEIVMPENYIAMFNAPGPDKAKELVLAAIPVMEQAADAISKNENFPTSRISFLDKLKSGAINKGFNKYFIKSNKFRAGDACIGCGQCVSACVMNNIKLENGKPLWSDRCTHCMACICGCPAETIEYGTSSVGRPRYRVPQIED